MAALTITPAEVLPVTGETKPVDGTAGEAIDAGQVVAKDSDKSIKLFDADNTNTYLAAAAGIALNKAAVSGQPIKYEAGDQVTIGTSAAPVVGKVYLGGRTAGTIVPVGDSTNSGIVNVIGVGMASGKLKLVLSNSGVTGQV